MGRGGWKFLVTEHFFSQKHLPEVLKRKNKCSWGSETHANKKKFRRGEILGCLGRPTRGSRGVGKRYTSSYDYDM